MNLIDGQKNYHLLCDCWYACSASEIALVRISSEKSFTSNLSINSAKLPFEDSFLISSNMFLSNKASFEQRSPNADLCFVTGEVP